MTPMASEPSGVFDDSQSRTGKWCTARCGDRVRAAAYRRTARYKQLRGGR